MKAYVTVCVYKLANVYVSVHVNTDEYVYVDACRCTVNVSAYDACMCVVLQHGTHMFYVTLLWFKPTGLQALHAKPHAPQTAIR